MARTYRVAFASIELTGLFGDTAASFQDALRESWEPGARVIRHRRKWRVSAPHESPIRSNSLTGHIGFVRENVLATLDFDEEANEFQRGAVTSGAVVPFAVDLASRTVAFQLVPGEVRTTSFTGAFQGLLNQSDTYYWRVRPLVRHMDFEQWREQVDRVTEFSFRLEEPNPHYHDQYMIEELQNEFGTHAFHLGGRGEEIKTNGSLFRQALDHVLRNYGRGMIRGEVDSYESEWRSSNGGTVPFARRVDSEDEEEITEDELVPLLDDVGGAFADPDDSFEQDDFEAS